ncbi:hypothetical protein DN390_07635 [Bacillus sp. SH7-1]|nr:hypothetical protein DN390_07635 [Bacillus sp. SH7-1]
MRSPYYFLLFVVLRCVEYLCFHYNKLLHLHQFIFICNISYWGKSNFFCQGEDATTLIKNISIPIKISEFSNYKRL